MITFAAGTRESWPSGAPNPADGQAVAVARREESSVSHDRLLTPSGYPGTLTASLLPGPGGAALPGNGDHPAVSCAFPPLPASAGRAREFTRVTLDDWGMAAHMDVAELVVCELVTNALRHGLLSGRWTPEDRPIGLTLLRRNVELMCLVTDPGSAGPVRVDVSAGAESGRGLQVVEACCAAWGWQPIDGAGKVVWAVLRLRGDAGPKARRGRRRLVQRRRTATPERPGEAGTATADRRPERPGEAGTATADRRPERPGSAAQDQLLRRAGRRTRHPWHRG